MRIPRAIANAAIADAYNNNGKVAMWLGGFWGGLVAAATYDWMHGVGFVVATLLLHCLLVVGASSWLHANDLRSEDKRWSSVRVRAPARVQSACVVACSAAGSPPPALLTGTQAQVPCSTNPAHVCMHDKKNIVPCRRSRPTHGSMLLIWSMLLTWSTVLIKIACVCPSQRSSR